MSTDVAVISSRAASTRAQRETQPIPADARSLNATAKALRREIRVGYAMVIATLVTAFFLTGALYVTQVRATERLRLEIHERTQDRITSREVMRLIELARQR